MADTVTSQTLLNGRRHLVMKFTNESDGTGETNVTKVDATSASNGVVLQGNTITPGTHLKVTEVQYDVKGMSLRMRWRAPIDQANSVDMLVLSGFGTLDFRSIGGLVAAANTNGSIDFTTVGAASGSSYSVVLTMTKGIPQS